MKSEITRKVRFHVNGDNYPLVLSNVMFGLDHIDLDNHETHSYTAEIVQYLDASKIDGQWVLCGNDDKKWDRAMLEERVPEEIKKIKNKKNHIYQFGLTCQVPSKKTEPLEFTYSGDCGSYADESSFYSDFVEHLEQNIETCVANSSLCFDTGWHSFKKSECSIKISASGRRVMIEASAYVSDEHMETLDSVCYKLWERSLSEMEESEEFKAYQKEWEFQSMGDVVNYLESVVSETSSTLETKCFSFRLNGPYSKALTRKVLQRTASLALSAIGEADKDFDNLCDRVKSIVDYEIQVAA